MKRILMTGATGFLGKNIVPVLLNDNFKISNLSPRTFGDTRVEDIFFDALIDDPEEILKGKDFDFVIHMAGYSSPKLATDVEKTRKVNVELTERLLKISKSFTSMKKFIFFSTALVYTPDTTQILNEDSVREAAPGDIYSASKIEAENICFNYALSGLPVKVLRLTNCFGPYQEWRGKPNLIPQIIAEAISKREIRVYNGAFARDFLYSKDLARIIKSLLEMKLPDILNIATGDTKKVIDVANFLSEKLSVPVIDMKEKLNKPFEIKIDNSKLLALLGDLKLTDFEEALDETLNYYLAEISEN